MKHPRKAQGAQHLMHEAHNASGSLPSGSIMIVYLVRTQLHIVPEYQSP